MRSNVSSHSIRTAFSVYSLEEKPTVQFIDSGFSIWSLKQITNIGLAGRPVTPQLIVELQSLNELSVLSLTGTQVTDADLDQLSEMRLRELYLTETQTTRNSLQKAMPNCKIYPEP